MCIKKISVSVLSFFLLFLLLPLIVYSATPTPPAAPSQSSTDTIQKFLQTMQKDIVEDVNRNMDDNFVELDKRMMSEIKAMFNKSIIAVIGGLSIVVFGFAFIQNRIQKHYEMNFYEKMMDAKLRKLSSSLPFVVSTDTFYSSVTMSQFDERHVTPAKYFERLSDNVAFKDYDRHIAELKSENERLRGLAEKFGKGRAGRSMYEPLSVAEPAKKKRLGIDMTALANTFKIMLISITIIVVIIIIIYLFMSGRLHMPFVGGNNSTTAGG